jgi:DNA-directed RNA polymerase subunit RPC12/RpoP
MEKIITCTHCQKTFKVSGPPSKAKQVAQGVTCPYCEQPTEVLWPMDAGLTTIPGKQASK